MYVCSLRTNKWSYDHRQEGAALGQKMSYIRQTAGDRGALKDIQIFGMSSWLRQVHDAVLKLFRDFQLREQRVRLLGDLAEVALTFAQRGGLWLPVGTGPGRGAVRLGVFAVLHRGGELHHLGDRHFKGLWGAAPVQPGVEQRAGLHRGAGALPHGGGQGHRAGHLPALHPGAAGRVLPVPQHGDVGPAPREHEVPGGQPPGGGGENGSGKTTFIKLLCRLYDPTQGEILLNGIDIRKYSYRQYIDLFSVVFQDFQLLAFPVGQNVAAAVEVDKGRAARCLEMAGFGKRLAALPQSLETPLYKEFDESGVQVSGGEAQKIALARALYKDAPFVVLDEPTAALDPVAEMEVYENFDKIVGDKTAVYISHRLSSCRFCDDIAVFDHGHIVQQGSHDALVEAPGKYQKLWHAQAQYYAKQEKEPGVE